MDNTERIIENIKSTMSMEGLTLSKEDITRIKECLEGKSSFDDEINKLIEFYTKK